MNSSSALAAVSPERVELLCDLERWADAHPLVRRLLASEPENDGAWCLLAQCELGLGRYESALTAAGQAVTLAPEHEWPYRLVSFAASQLGRHGTAVHAARAAVRLEPEVWQTHARLAAPDAGVPERARAGPRQCGRRSGPWPSPRTNPRSS
jgi:tetratricopeptide (TPR) repeat protein